MSAAQKACLITGGSSGIGLATAKKFATQGFGVAICGRDANKLQSAQASIRAETDRDCLALATDVGDFATATELVNHTREHFGRIDVVINNAGAAPNSPLDTFPDQAFENALDTNIRGVFAICRAAWPALVAASPSTIINISSRAAVDPFPGFSVYGGCKAWVDTFTLAIAEEGKAVGITTYSVRLGAVETPMLRGLFPDFPSEQALQPAEVADFLMQLATHPGQHASGAAIAFEK